MFRVWRIGICEISKLSIDIEMSLKNRSKLIILILQTWQYNVDGIGIFYGLAGL